jgi:hypothetical protein
VEYFLSWHASGQEHAHALRLPGIDRNGESTDTELEGARAKRNSQKGAVLSDF